MEGKPSKVSRSISTTKSAGSSRPVRQESSRSGANLTTTMPEASGRSRPSTITLPQQALERMIRSLKADADPSLILALMGAVPTQLPESEGSHLFTITLTREVLVRMIRVLKPDADPSLVLALIGADLVPPPAGATDIPETEGENASRSEEVRTVEPGEEVEQQPQAGEARLEVEQEPDIEATGVEESADTTVTPTTELEQQLILAEKSTEASTVQRDEVMDIVRQITLEVEPSPSTGAPEETRFEVIPTKTAVPAEPREDAEQPLLTPEEVIADLATRNSEGAEVNMDMEVDRIVEWHPTERAEVTTCTREERNSGGN